MREKTAKYFRICMKSKIISIIILFIVLGMFIYLQINRNLISFSNNNKPDLLEEVGGLINEKHPLSIAYMREQEYPGSDITIEQTLPDGSNYSRYIVSYKSDGLKIYALLTIPIGDPSASSQDSNRKYPVIVFNHGYIPPAEYRTTERYIAYTDAFSRNGYIVFRPDYRGHGNSEGQPEGAYYSPAYTIDVLNAVSSIKKLNAQTLGLTNQSDPIVDTNRIGMWGHSMGGSITLRSMVVTKDIKAGVIWAGVVANYEDMAANWRRSRPWMPSQREQAFRRPGRQALIDRYGDFDKNPVFWNSISPISFVKDISGPMQIHHGTADEEVPILFSERLNDALKGVGKTVEYYTYEGDDHNISGNLDTALQRSVEFFNRYLK